MHSFVKIRKRFTLLLLVITGFALFIPDQAVWASPPRMGVPFERNGVSLIIERNGSDVTRRYRTVWAGQKMYFRVKASNGAALSNITWSVPGSQYDRIAKWDPDTAGSHITNLTILDEEQLNFYWINGGGKKRISVTASVAGLGNLQSYVDYNVKRPQNNVIVTILHGVFARMSPGTNFGFPPGVAMGFGDLSSDKGGGLGEHGINFDATFPNSGTEPSSPYGGNVSWVQIIEDWTDTNGSLPTCPGLDTRYPASTGLNHWDSPGEYAIATNGYHAWTLTINFSTYLMWQPPVEANSKSIPISLKKITY